jgi:hypothetical protein
MDTVVFTGITPLERYKEERPADYRDIRANGELRKRVIKMKISKEWRIAVRVFGYVFLTIGLILVGLIIYSVLFGYK